jgi:hypothetical protein
MQTSTSYTVRPSYCTGNNEEFDLSADDLRTFLISELDEATEPGDERLDPDLRLAEVLALGDDFDDFIRFDVTRPGCLQSTLGVSPA